MAYQPEFFSGAMRSDAGDFESGIRVVPLGIGAIGIQSCGAAGTDIIVGVLGAYRICVWKIVDFAEGKVRVGGGDGGTGGYFRRNARVIGGADALECASGAGRVARDRRKAKFEIERVPIAVGRLFRLLLGLRNFDDDVAWLGQAKFVAGDGFDFVGIGLEGFYFVGKLGVFFGEAVDVFLNPLDFEFGATHGEKAVSAENVVDEQRKDAKDEDGAPVLRPKNRDS